MARIITFVHGCMQACVLTLAKIAYLAAQTEHTPSEDEISLWQPVDQDVWVTYTRPTHSERDLSTVRPCLNLTEKQATTLPATQTLLEVPGWH